MSSGAFYIYALKDPRSGKPFYIGKGTGIRAWSHIANVDKSSKGKRISEIQNLGHEVDVAILVSDLSEFQALRLEAELIYTFGTEASGGWLTNIVSPNKNVRVKPPRNLNIPFGSREKAQLGLQMLKDAVIDLAKANSNGILNSEIVKAYDLQSDYLGGSKDYLSWSLLGLLMRDRKIKRLKNSRKHVVIAG
jgi:hypothetical protein